MSQIPLNAAASNGDNNRQVTTSLPPEVVQCLENARFVSPFALFRHPIPSIFSPHNPSQDTTETIANLPLYWQLHLATCTNNVPTVSLMNYTYLPPSTSPFTPNHHAPLIIMTTNPASKKMANLLSNPHVSLLVHDWVSHRPPTTSARRMSSNSTSSPPPQPRSSLASLLLNLNTSAMSSISATINGAARLVAPGSDEERWLRQAHLENNTFEEGGGEGGGRGAFNPFGQIASAAGGTAEDGGRECFVAGEEVRVIVVDVRDVRISDWKGNVKDWVLVGPGEEAGREQAALVVNGM